MADVRQLLKFISIPEHDIGFFGQPHDILWKRFHNVRSIQVGDQLYAGTLRIVFIEEPTDVHLLRYEKALDVVELGVRVKQLQVLFDERLLNFERCSDVRRQTSILSLTQTQARSSFDFIQLLKTKIETSGN